MKASSLIDRAKELRKNGFSLREISEQLKISKSTASLWLREVVISDKGRQRIGRLNDKSREKARKSIKDRIKKEDEAIKIEVKEVVDRGCFSRRNSKIACALLYWCEGEKSKKGSMAFANSDPVMIKYFLDVFRKAFDVDEKKFRVMLHVHDYHDPIRQIEFWSKITRIRRSQFYNPYRKSSGGIRKKEDYQGCVSVRYYDNKIFREILFLIDEISK